MRVENLTPHAVVLCQSDGTPIRSIPPTGASARCAVTDVLIGHVDDMPVYRAEYGEVYDLPDPQADTMYIVSAIVAQACKGKRNDLYIPYKTVRDKAGRIVGCEALAQV